MTEEPKQISNREVKSSAFTTFFSNPENAAKLYAALEEGDPISPEDIEYNDNMPLRDAIYYGRTMEKMIEPRELYRTGRIAIPTPEFFVFYNGEKDFPEEKILKLSDAYLEKTEQPMLELTVRAININLPANHPILDRCRPLYEYAWFIEKMKAYIRNGKSRDAAIIQAMADCRQEGILEVFLREHGTEAVNMLFTQFNMDDALEVRYEEGKEDGKAEGKAVAIQFMTKLVTAMVADGRTEELERLNRDSAFLEAMLVQYDIKEEN